MTQSVNIKNGNAATKIRVTYGTPSAPQVVDLDPNGETSITLYDGCTVHSVEELPREAAT